jgi:hypothetical protein
VDLSVRDECFYEAAMGVKGDDFCNRIESSELFEKCLKDLNSPNTEVITDTPIARPSTKIELSPPPLSSPF